MATRYRYRVVLALIAMHLCAMAQSANPAKYAACYETKILSSHKSDIALGRYLPKRFRLRTEHVSQSTHYQVEILDSPTQDDFLVGYAGLRLAEDRVEYRIHRLPSFFKEFVRDINRDGDVRFRRRIAQRVLPGFSA